MDQLKEKLAVAIKYGFWIGSAVVFLGSLGVWYWTTSKLAAESASQTSKIKNAISTVSTIESELFKHPNELSHEQMNVLIAKRQEEVLQSWKTLYDRQRNILTWPEAELTKNFVDEFRDLIPIEVFVPFPTPETEEKETTLLRTYQRYIKKVLPDIAKIAKAEWTAEFESAAGGAGGYGQDMGAGYGGFAGEGSRGMPVDITGAKDGPLVKWSEASQSAILSDLFPWRGTMPSTLEVYYSQENIWILKQLLQIVADVNGEARQPYQAKIHEITGLGIGKSVKFTSGTISKPGDLAMAGGMGMSGMEMGGMEMEGYGEMGGEYGEMDSSGMMAETLDPADNRYVNEALESIEGASLRAALTSNSPSDVALAVAKRVPVMMSLKMDQRAVSDLLAACGSAPLMVEVKQVRILPQTNTPGGGGSEGPGGQYGSGGGSDYGSDYGMDGGEGGMGGMGGYGGAPAVKAGPVQEFPLDMTVEVYGLIYMYNPPDPLKLGLEQVTKENVDELVEDAPAPAATEANGELPVPQGVDETGTAVPPAGRAPAGQVPGDRTPAGAAPVTTDPVISDRGDHRSRYRRTVAARLV